MWPVGYWKCPVLHATLRPRFGWVLKCKELFSRFGCIGTHLGGMLAHLPSPLRRPMCAEQGLLLTKEGFAFLCIVLMVTVNMSLGSLLLIPRTLKVT